VCIVCVCVCFCRQAYQVICSWFSQGAFPSCCSLYIALSGLQAGKWMNYPAWNIYSFLDLTWESYHSRYSRPDFNVLFASSAILLSSYPKRSFKPGRLRRVLSMSALKASGALILQSMYVVQVSCSCYQW